jgi:hypothetical protein
MDAKEDLKEFIKSRIRVYRRFADTWKDEGNIKMALRIIAIYEKELEDAEAA